MRVGKSSRSETRRRGLAALGLAVMAVSVAGCYQNPDPTEWNAKAKSNFIAGCSTDVTAKGGTTTSIAIASSDTCECIYELIKKPESGEQGKWGIDWDDLKDYESKQADAKPADAPCPSLPLTALHTALAISSPPAARMTSTSWPSARSRAWRFF